MLVVSGQLGPSHITLHINDPGPKELVGTLCRRETAFSSAVYWMPISLLSVP